MLSTESVCAGPSGRKETNFSVRCSGSRPHPATWLSQGPGQGAPPRLTADWLVSPGGHPEVPNPLVPWKMRKSGWGKAGTFLRAAASRHPTPVP